VSADDGYEAGDINQVEAEAPDDLESVYEAGDINTVAGDEDFADEADEEPGDEAGNRADGGTPTAVLDYLARSLANEPDSVIVQTEVRQGSVRLRLHVAPDDMGRVIGRRGRTAQALRTLVGVAGAVDGVQTSVDIVDD